MKNSELITELQKLDPNLDVYLNDSRYGGIPMGEAIIISENFGIQNEPFIVIHPK